MTAKPRTDYTPEEKKRLAEWAAAGNNQPPVDLDPMLVEDPPMPAEQHITLKEHEIEMEELDRSTDEIIRFWRAKALKLEAELLAAQQAGDNALFDIGKLRERLQAARASLKANQDELRSCQEREKALREALETVEPLIDAQFEGHADMGEYMVKVQKLNEALDVVRAALAGTAGSPSEKPDSEEEA